MEAIEFTRTGSTNWRWNDLLVTLIDGVYVLTNPMTGTVHLRAASLDRMRNQMIDYGFHRGERPKLVR